MEIYWKGQSLFYIKTEPVKNKEVSIVIDPYDASLGLPLPSLTADILLISHEHPNHNNVKLVKGEPFVVRGPGEYDIKNIYIEGIEGFHGNKQGAERGKITIYTIESEDIKICHLSDLGQKELTEKQLERIGDVDILMIPVGGTYTISAKEAPDIINQIDPKIVIPMHYALPGLKYKFDKVDKFLKEMGTKNPEIVKKLKIKKKDIPAEMKIVLFKYK